MSSDRTKNLVRDTLEQPFDSDRFLYFIQNLLNSFDQTIASTQTVDNDLVDQIKCLGRYKDPDKDTIDILMIRFKKATSIDLARSLQRKLVADYLAKNAEVDAALIAFTSPSPDWRFSFVKVSYKIDNAGTKIKLNKELTPIKRYSFLVGPNESSYTAKSQLLPILNQETAVYLNQIENAFSVEKVTDQFYLEYRELFELVVAELKKNHTQLVSFNKNVEVTYENFVKKLLGQFTFIYFIQKKGWLGAAEKASIEQGDKHFIQNLFLKCKSNNQNFFREYLEPLFYETLNAKPERVADYYREYFDCQVPFLNGGLFDPDFDRSKTMIHLDNRIFDSIFGVFDRYNFTIKEDEPLDKEVAIDPEMLGKVFENLLEENLRKGKGTFYTPREIVNYMCEQSLIRYILNTHPDLTEDNVAKYILCANTLATSPDKLGKVWKAESFKPGQYKQLDDLLKTVKIVDPACGSGAFLVGMLQLIVRLRRFLQLTVDAANIKQYSEYDLKKETIENCIFGVDIDPGATEIAKLRLWLSLVVDHEIGEIKPLPNLDYKIMVGNSLVESLYIPSSKSMAPLFDYNSFRQVDPTQRMKNLFEKENQFSLFEESQSSETKNIVNTIIEKKHQLINSSDYQVKISIKENINQLENKLVSKSLAKELENVSASIKNIQRGLFNGRKMKELAQLKGDRQFFSTVTSNPELLNQYKNSNLFLWKLHFIEVFDKGGFDIVIANPPYVSTKGRTDDDKEILEQTYGFADDLYSHFYFQGLKICKANGIIAYITSKTFWTIQTKRNLRNLLQSRLIHEIADTASPFSAMVDTCVLIASNSSADMTDYSITFKVLEDKDELDLNYSSAYKVKVGIYRQAVNQVFFVPSKLNLQIYSKYNEQVKKLHNEWWEKIETSSKITKNKDLLNKYRNGLKPGDITLLGLITDGGQGLATANNGKYVGIFSTSKEGIALIAKRAIKYKQTTGQSLPDTDEQNLRKLFEAYKLTHGRDVFGQGFLYQIVSPDEVRDVSTMTDEEKQNGIVSVPTFVPYDKGDKDGNRWYLRTPYYINWSRENVQTLQKDPNARWQGYQFFFRPGFCWTNVSTPINEESKFIKCRMKDSTINDVGSMSMYPSTITCSTKYLVSLMNSKLFFHYLKAFINQSVNLQLNDIRALPVIIPTLDQIKTFEDIFDRAYAIKVQQFDDKITGDVADKQLAGIQKELDEKVYDLYKIKTSNI